MTADVTHRSPSYTTGDGCDLVNRKSCPLDSVCLHGPRRSEESVTSDGDGCLFVVLRSSPQNEILADSQYLSSAKLRVKSRRHLDCRSLTEIDAALYGSFLDDKVDSDGAPRNIISPCKQTRYQGRGDDLEARTRDVGCVLGGIFCVSNPVMVSCRVNREIVPSSRNTILTKDPSTRYYADFTWNVGDVYVARVANQASRCHAPRSLIGRLQLQILQLGIFAHRAQEPEYVFKRFPPIAAF